MKRKRRRTRTRWKPAPFLWIAVILNVSVGFAYSPITSAIRIKIDGADEGDHVAIAEAVQSLERQPCLRADIVRVQSRILTNPAIESVEIDRSIFGSARVRVKYRKLVARFWTNPKIGLSEDGSMFHTERDLSKLPVLKLPPDEVRVALGAIATWDSRRFAEFCAAAQKSWPDVELRIEQSEDEGVCLNIGSGRVVLGSLDDLDFKLKVLRERLARNPRELDDIRELILTQPTLPKIHRKPGDIDF